MNLETSLPPALWDAVRTNLERRHFAGAVLDAFYFLSDLLREKSGAVGDGATLVGQALGGANPKIRINKLQSESEKNVQKGVEMTLRGIYQAFRNPRSHEKINDSEEDAQVLILFIGYLTRQIDQAKSQFSQADFTQRVFDPDFVPSRRYAELLVSEVPSGRLLDVFIDAFRVMETGDCDNLKHFFTALLGRMTAEETRIVSEVVSETLRITDDESKVRQIISCLEALDWRDYTEVARIRIENRLVKSVREGRFDSGHGRCRSGSLGTWAGKLLPQFTLRDEMLEAISDKMCSDSEEERDYALRFFFGRLAGLADSMPPRISRALVSRLRYGDERFYHAVVNNCPWDSKTLPAELTTAISEFDSGFPPEEDLPF